MRYARKLVVRVAILLLFTVAGSGCSLPEVNAWRHRSGLAPIAANDPIAVEALTVADSWWTTLDAAAQEATLDAATGRPAERATTGHAAGLQMPDALKKIAACESGNGRTGSYSLTARNPSSSAAGKFQFLSGTWQYVARTYASTWQAHGWENLRQEATSVPSMAHAREAVQDAAASVLYEREGTRPWAASRGCWG